MTRARNSAWALPLVMLVVSPGAHAQYPYGSYSTAPQPVARVEYTYRYYERETIIRSGPRGYSIEENITRQTIANGRSVTTNDYYRESLRTDAYGYDWRRDSGGSYQVRPAQTTYYLYGR